VVFWRAHGTADDAGEKIFKPDASNDQIISYALVFYGLPLVGLIFAGRYWAK
jgi:hypothetical protein